MAAQLDLALDNLEAVLAGAGMTLTNLVRLNAYTTDVDAYLEHSVIISDRRDGARCATRSPPSRRPSTSTEEEPPHE